MGMQEPTPREPRMLKRQVELNFTRTADADRIWGSIPERCRRQIAQDYARLIGNLAKGECVALKDKERVDDDDS